MAEEKLNVKRPRNFWVEVEIDGQKTKLRGGPVAKTDGLKINLYQRDKGEAKKAIALYCREENGKLLTEIYFNGVYSGKYETER